METLTLEQQRALAMAAARARMAESQERPVQETKPERNIWQRTGDDIAGLARGAGSIGATLLTPYDYLAGNTKSIVNPERRKAMDEALELLGADTQSNAFKAWKMAGETAGTAGVPMARGGGYVADILKNVGGGAAAAAMVNPQDAGTGAAIGGGLTAIGRPVVASSKWAYENFLKPASRLMQKGGETGIVRDYITKLLGEKNIATTVDAARSNKSWIPGYKPKLDEAMVQYKTNPVTGKNELVFLPEGSPLSKLTQLEGTQTGGSSAEFGRRIASQDLAIQSAEKARDAITAPMRETALTNANIAGEVGIRLANKQRVLEKIASEGAEDVRRFTAAGERAGQRAHTTVMVNGKPVAATTAVPGYPRQPGRYTYMGELGKKAEDVATSAAESSLKAGEAARFNKYQLDSLAAHGYYPLTTGSIENSIRALRSKPGNKSNITLQQALGDISKIMKSVTDDVGIVDARELYTIRKLEAGNVIEKYARENASWDKNFTSGLLKDVQHAIDDAVENAGGAGWKDYLAEYAKRSKAIDLTVARRELAQKPPQPTSISGGRDVAKEGTPQIGQMLYRPIMMTNWTLRLFGGAKEPAVDELLTKVLTDPSEYVKLMEQATPAAKQQANKALEILRSSAIAASSSE